MLATDDTNDQFEVSDEFSQLSKEIDEEIAEGYLLINKLGYKWKL